MQTFIDLPFADGIYTFKLGLAQINELQDKCKVGIGGLAARVFRGRYADDEGGEVGNIVEAEFRSEDVIEIVRQGLIGGGAGEVDGVPVKVSAIVANRLVENYLLPSHMTERWRLAAAILSALIFGYDPPKKAGPAAAPAATEA